ncbi:hypothetical protein EC110512_C02790 [Escherichia coli O111:H-]|nr:hypothetical protein EC110512_C02790 [Escherichia coli O111:H-]
MAFPVWRKWRFRSGGNGVSGLAEKSLPQKAQHRPQAVLFVVRIRRLRRIRQVRHYCSRLETMLDMLLDCFSMVMPVCISTCCLVILDASVA